MPASGVVRRGKEDAGGQTLVAEIALQLLDVHVLRQRVAAGEVTTDEAVLVGLLLVLGSDQQVDGVLVLVVHLPMHPQTQTHARAP